MRPHRRQPTRLPRPWDSLGMNTGVGCHFLLNAWNMLRRNVSVQTQVTKRCYYSAPRHDLTTVSPSQFQIHYDLMDHPQQAREKDKSPNKEEKPKRSQTKGIPRVRHKFTAAHRIGIYIYNLTVLWADPVHVYDEKSVICDWLTRCLLNSEKVFCVTWDSCHSDMDTRKLFHNPPQNP